MIEGPNGPGGVETVSVSVNGIPSTRGVEGGVTQGELLRQEQRAGVVPVSQLEGNRGDTDGMGEEDEVPHARGPEEIGMEDMGPQDAGSASQRAGPGVGMQGIDVEAAVGRRVDAKEDESEGADEQVGELPLTPKREAEDNIGAAEKRLRTDGKGPEIEAGNVDGAEKKADTEALDKETGTKDAAAI